MKQHDLPIKVIVLNNNGYLSIRETQDQFLEGRHLGSAPAGLLTLPSIQAVTESYGLPYTLIRESGELSEVLQAYLLTDGPAVCEVLVRDDQKVIPRLGFALQPDGSYRTNPLSLMDPPRDGLPTLEYD